MALTQLTGAPSASAFQSCVPEPGEPCDVGLKAEEHSLCTSQKSRIQKMNEMAKELQHELELNVKQL